MSTIKRNTDVSRLRPTPVQEPAATGARSAACTAAVERATTLLIHGMQQSETPICELSNALARMAQKLSDIGTPLFGADDGRPVDPTSPQLLRDALARDIAVCIQSLQFHDRLMQQLAQARDILTGTGANRLLDNAPQVPANDGSIEGSIELF